MLYIALILVVAALAGVVAALITANSLWAWISIGLSVVAGLILLVDWLRRRSKPAADAGAEGVEEKPEAESSDKTKTDADVTADESTATDGATESRPSEDTVGAAAEAEPELTGQTAMLPATGELSPRRVDANGDPLEEDTDAADLLIISELDTQVLVVDEYPRYHLEECGWLAKRDTIPLPVSEARELGFTPCARCGPDAKLAGAHRSKRKKSKAEG